MLQRNLKWLGKRSVKDYLKRPEAELYDLENDPDELRNLVKNADYSFVLNELKSKLREKLEQTNDPWLIIENQRANREFYKENFVR